MADGGVTVWQKKRRAQEQLDGAAIAQACLLLDVRMPVMSGLQVHDELIALGITGAGATPALPVVYMTGHGDVPLAVKAMEKGAITFLEKPFEGAALEEALKHAFQSHQAPSDSLPLLLVLNMPVVCPA